MTNENSSAPLLEDIQSSNNRHPVQSKAADQKYCFSCGNALHHSATNCPKCGAVQPVHVESPVSPYQPLRSPPQPNALPQHHVYCRGCGLAIHESAPTCPKCGAVLESLSMSGKSKKTKAEKSRDLLGIDDSILGSGLDFSADSLLDENLIEDEEVIDEGLDDIALHDEEEH